MYIPPLFFLFLSFCLFLPLFLILSFFLSLVNYPFRKKTFQPVTLPLLLSWCVIDFLICFCIKLLMRETRERENKTEREKERNKRERERENKTEEKWMKIVSVTPSIFTVGYFIFFLAVFVTWRVSHVFKISPSHPLLFLSPSLFPSHSVPFLLSCNIYKETFLPPLPPSSLSLTKFFLSLSLSFRKFSLSPLREVSLPLPSLLPLYSFTIIVTPSSSSFSFLILGRSRSHYTLPENERERDLESERERERERLGERIEKGNSAQLFGNSSQVLQIEMRKREREEEKSLRHSWSWPTHDTSSLYPSLSIFLSSLFPIFLSPLSYLLLLSLSLLILTSSLGNTLTFPSHSFPSLLFGWKLVTQPHAFFPLFPPQRKQQEVVFRNKTSLETEKREKCNTEKCCNLWEWMNEKRIEWLPTFISFPRKKVPKIPS